MSPRRPLGCCPATPTRSTARSSGWTAATRLAVARDPTLPLLPPETVTMEEVAPGIHRIESNLGPRFMAQYLLVGEDRTVLVDTGLASTPDDVLAPALT